MREERGKEEESRASLLLGSAAAATLLLGLTWALKRTRRQAAAQPVPFFRSNVASLLDPSFSPVLHAAKALGIGTLLCCGSATVLVLAGRAALDVHTLPEFSMRMRQLLGKATPKLQERLAHQNGRESQAQQAAEDREWQAIWDEGRRIDAERAEYKRRRKQQKHGQEEPAV